MYGDRSTRLTRAMAEAELDAVAVVPGPNLEYLTGLSFHLSERPTVAFFTREGNPILLVPSLEETKAASAPFPCRVVTYTDADGPEDAFSEALRTARLEGSWLGVEGRRFRYLELDLIARTGLDPGIFDADEVFAELRIRKDESEIASMRRAVAVAETAFREVLPMVRAGATERAIAAELTVQILRGGGEPDLPFAPLVASGPNGANPHGFPSERALRPGDVVTIDWGARVDGYVSDITRNVAVDGAAPHEELVRAHDVVRAANAAGRAAARPGATGEDVDRATRDVIEQAGLGAFFIHRTGHGIGLEGHEAPNMNARERAPLAPGMTFTVEPGVYIPELGGVRIEDDMLVTGDGAESLTSLPREFLASG